MRVEYEDPRAYGHVMVQGVVLDKHVSDSFYNYIVLRDDGFIDEVAAVECKAEVLSIAGKLHIAKRTAEKYIHEFVDKLGIVQRVDNGQYMKSSKAFSKTEVFIKNK
nr:MAG TPA: Transcriptional regulatory protein RcsB factor, DNA BINDING PROTEIN.6A [Caudoviricetes sp.]